MVSLSAAKKAFNDSVLGKAAAVTQPKYMCFVKVLVSPSQSQSHQASNTNPHKWTLYLIASLSVANRVLRERVLKPSAVIRVTIAKASVTTFVNVEPSL
jgi:hypothetical protein